MEFKGKFMNFTIYEDWDGQIVIYDEKGKVQETEYITVGCADLIHANGQDFYVVTDGKKYGLVNYKGDIVLPIVYTTYDFQAWTTYDIVFTDDSGVRIYNVKTNKIREEVYECILSSYKNRSFYKRNGLYGLMDEKLNEIIPPTYDSCGTFSYGKIARVYREDKLGAVDRNGKEVIPTQFADYTITGRHRNIVIVETVEGHFGVYVITDDDSKCILGPKYDDIKFVYNNHFEIVRIGKKFGLMDAEGNTIMQVAYDSIEITKKDGRNYFIVENDETKFIIDEKGNTI
ncbi:MAG: WG repeat-containing protein [Clostridia bacterium]|nr:WG repeat-containing protein [Clostridia bacterium]